MVRFARAMVTGVALVAAAQAAGAAPAAKPTTFECKFVVRTPTHGIIERATVTTKGDLLRLQKRTGAGLKLLFIRNRQGTYHINLHTNDGAKWPAEWAKDVEKRLVTGGPQGDPWAFLKSVKAQKTSREKIDGRAVDVWTYSLPVKQGKSQEVKVYMDVGEKRPVKLEMRRPVSPTKMDLVTIEYEEYRWGFALADSFFGLPPGAKLVDLGNPEAGTITVPGDPKKNTKAESPSRGAAIRVASER